MLRSKTWLINRLQVKIKYFLCQHLNILMECMRKWDCDTHVIEEKSFNVFVRDWKFPVQYTCLPDISLEDVYKLFRVLLVSFWEQSTVCTAGHHFQRLWPFIWLRTLYMETQKQAPRLHNFICIWINEFRFLRRFSASVDCFWVTAQCTWRLNYRRFGGSLLSST